MKTRSRTPMVRKRGQGPSKEVDMSFPQILLWAEAHKVLLGVVQVYGSSVQTEKVEKTFL